MTRNGRASLGDVLRKETVGGALLLTGGLLALAWANSPWHELYESVRHFSFGPEALHLHLSAEEWAADALLAIFFFIVGVELKEEFVFGELRHPARALLPIVAAICGMVVPALFYVVINLTDPEALPGWGVPMATDIAFALAVLAVIGRNLPSPVRIFLLTLAVVDDLGAIAVIAIFYTTELNMLALGGAILGLVAFGYLQRRRPAFLYKGRATGWLTYLSLAAVIWTLMHASGIHATVAGVAMGLLMRESTVLGEDESPAGRARIALQPWSSGLVLPVFALMSAGVSFLETGVGSVFTDSAAIGIMAGLVLGKIVGVFGGSYLTVRFTGAQLNPRIGWSDMFGVAVLTGIGFTVSLLISELAFAAAPHRLDHAKAGVLIASLVATALAAVVLGFRNRHHRELARSTARQESGHGGD